MIPRWLRAWSQINRRTINSKRQHRLSAGKQCSFWKPFLEHLEDRTMPSVTFSADLPAAPASSNIKEIPLGSLHTNSDATVGFPIEPQITVNPANPSMIAVSSQNVLEVSVDGGKDFSTRVYFPLPTGGSSIPGGDTSTVFDSKGRLFWANLVNLGGPNEALYVAQVLVDTSGFITPTLSFATGSPFLVDNSGTAVVGPAGDDKEFLAVDGNNNLYIAWTQFSGTTFFGTSSILLSRSTPDSSGNVGRTWSAPITVSQPVTGQYIWPSTVTVATDGTVLVAYHRQGTVANADPTKPPLPVGTVEVARYTKDLQPIEYTYPFGTGLTGAFIRGLAPDNVTYPNDPFPFTSGTGESWILADPSRPQYVYLVAVR
jgi:hypothetical protein